MFWFHWLLIVIAMGGIILLVEVARRVDAAIQRAIQRQQARMAVLEKEATYGRLFAAVHRVSP